MTDRRRRRRRRRRRPKVVPRAAADFVWQLKIEIQKGLYSKNEIGQICSLIDIHFTNLGENNRIQKAFINVVLII